MSTQPIPQHIEARAVRLANEEAERAAKAGTVKGAKAIARRLRAEAAAENMTVKQYIEALTKDPKGVTPPEGTAPTSAFWSFGVEHPEAPKNHWGQHFLDNRYLAEAWAQVQNEAREGSAQTLETSDGGRRLNEMYLWEPKVLEALGGAEKGFTEDWTRQCWGDISETYATAAKGPVAVFAQYADTRSILYNRELPTLHANEDVGLDNIRFAYEAPQAWPQQTRTELGTDAARAVLQFNDPTQAHFVDPAAYPTQDPAQRRAALETEFATVTAERAERAARKRAEQETAQAAEQETAQAAETTAQPTAEAAMPAAPAAEAATPATPVPEAPVPATSATEAEAETQNTPEPATPPVWQLGFTPKPVVATPASTAPAAESKAPPSPDLGKQATGMGLG